MPMPACRVQGSGCLQLMSGPGTLTRLCPSGLERVVCLGRGRVAGRGQKDAELDLCTAQGPRAVGSPGPSSGMAASLRTGPAFRPPAPSSGALIAGRAWGRGCRYIKAEQVEGAPTSHAAVVKSEEVAVPAIVIKEEPGCAGGGAAVARRGEASSRELAAELAMLAPMVGRRLPGGHVKDGVMQFVSPRCRAKFSKYVGVQVPRALRHPCLSTQRSGWD